MDMEGREAGGGAPSGIRLSLGDGGTGLHDPLKLRLLTTPPGSGYGMVGMMQNNINEAPLQTEVRVAMETKVSSRPAAKYGQCLKNHAASLGHHAIDGCGEFIPGGEEGTLEAMKCGACNCHRNFHRREGEVISYMLCADCRQARDQEGIKQQFVDNSATVYGASASNYRTPNYRRLSQSSNSQMTMALTPDQVEGVLVSPSLSMQCQRLRSISSQEQKQLENVWDQSTDKVGWSLQNQKEGGRY